MSEYPVKTPKKLIEVALPLDAINAAASKEKSIRHGHPSTLHLWWARRPLAAARAVLFAQLVNDPGYERHLQRGVNKEQAALERDRLFKIIEKLVLWENTNNEEVLEASRKEIWKSWRETCKLNKDHPQAAELFNPDKLPAFHDPFAGGGAIPLEAQRLGLESYASDLNPVAVLINRAMIELPPKFANKPAVGPISPEESQRNLHDDWSGSKGLAEDVRRYGAWIRAEAEKRIGRLYPKVEVTVAMAKDRPDLEPLVGHQLTVISWLWTRTVKSPNPAFSHVHVPLVSSFRISTNKGKEAWVDPVVTDRDYTFVVRVTGMPSIEETVNRKGGICLLSGSPMPFTYIREEGKAGRMSHKLMAIVAESPIGRVYLSPNDVHEEVAISASPSWSPDLKLPNNTRDFKTPNYGIGTFADLFTSRQLVALTTLSDLIQETVGEVRKAALGLGYSDDERGLESGGEGAVAYGQAIGTYLAFAANKCSDYWCTISTWMPRGTVGHVFSKQAIPMTWDYPEANPLGDFHCGWQEACKWVGKSFDCFSPGVPGSAHQLDARTQTLSKNGVISTDPPYYDNINYAELSDFFYIWLRLALKSFFPSLFATVAVPKAEELVASPYRHGNKTEAEAFFLVGMSRALHNLLSQCHPAFPITIYYAFKQSETKESSGTSSTGWETFLEAVMSAGLSIGGTWPLRTERAARSIGMGANALASSILLVCRKRSEDAPAISRREFIRELNEALPIALDEMTRGGVNSPVAAVDLSQAIIGPGMAIFSKYSAVLEADGSRMSVQTALQLINRFLAEDDFDHDTQFCLHWFDNYGWSEGKFGEADVLARAKGTSVEGVKNAGVLASAKGVVQLLRWRDYPQDWNPEQDHRTPIWEALHYMILTLQQKSATDAGALLAKMPTRAEPMRQLAYRLYTLCERKGWAEDARAYNDLITSWNGIETSSHEVGHVGKQEEMDV
ncbi:DUF1156 domain-containing protein [bacterium]|nr:DUF1156 domain-containing protein [bacterium]